MIGNVAAKFGGDQNFTPVACYLTKRGNYINMITYVHRHLRKRGWGTHIHSMHRSVGEYSQLEKTVRKYKYT